MTRATAGTTDDMVLLGHVSGVFGVKGWVKIHSYTQPRDNILTYSPWYLYLDGQWQPREVVAGKVHGKGLIAQIAGCDDRNAAEELVRAQIAIYSEQLPELDEDEVYWRDLQGLEVRTVQGVSLGIVTGLMETGANDVLVVKAEDGKERLIPYIREDVITDIGLEEGTITVDWDPDF